MSNEKLVKQNEELEYQLKCKEQELQEYKKSKQASYEAMQRKCNKIELKNRALQKEYLCLKEEIKILGDKFNSSNRAWEEIFDRYKEALAPFEDEFFKYLDTKTIAELAKKSFRLTRENRNLEDVLDEIEEIAGDYTGCDDVGHFIQDTRARHVLEDVSQAMVDICERINDTKEVNNAG